MQSGRFHSLKLLFLFAAVTSGSVLAAILLHRSGRLPQTDSTRRVEAASILPVPSKSMRPPALTAFKPPVEEVVRAAIPVTVSEPVEKNPERIPDRALLASLSPQIARKTDPFPEDLRQNSEGPLPVATALPPVYQAVLTHDLEWLERLLKAGFSPDDTTVGDDTALCAAVQGGFVEGVELLLANGANVARPGREGQPPLALAALRRNEPMMAALLRGGADPNTTYVTPLPQVLLDEVPQTELKYSLRTDSNVTVLMACAARGDVEATVALLRHGAKTNAYTKKHSRYAINFAASQRYLFVMRILLGRAPDAEPDLLVTIDLSQQRAWVERNGQVIDSTKVSTGREGYGTPAGRYVVTDKHRSWTSTLYHVSMPWFMRLNCSSIGMHSGYVTGRPASHGCIRLPYDKARKWFGIVKVGDEVQIVR